MKIAVLSNHFSETMKWLTANKEITHVNLTERTFKDKKGNSYFIVSKVEHIMGMEFDSYIKAPDYSTLEDYLKTRIPSSSQRSK